MEKSCFGCAVLEHSEWQALKKDEIAQLDQNKTCSHFERGGVIFNEGDPYTGVYCICEGLVGIRKLDGNGNTILLGRIGYAGTKLGYRPFLAGENHRATTETLEPSTLCFIKDAVVRALLRSNTELCGNFLKSAAKALGYAEEDYFQNATRSLRTQVIRQLLLFKGRYGKETKDGTIRIDLPLSRGGLAAMFGVRLESLSRAIRGLRDDGLVQFSGRTARILNLQELFDEMGSQLPS